MVFEEDGILSRKRLPRKRELVMVKLFQYFIKLYTFLLSPILGKNCRFHPTCSAYAHQSLERHGVLKGLYLAITRIFSCHPYSKRNFSNPVPSTFAWKSILGYKRPTLEKDILAKDNLKGSK